MEETSLSLLSLLDCFHAAKLSWYLDKSFGIVLSGAPALRHA